MRRRLVRGTVGSLGLYGSSKLLMLVASVLLARTLGTKGYGDYVTILAVVALLGVPTAMGLPTLVVRLVSAYSARGEWSAARGLLLDSNRLVFVLGTTIAGLGLVASWLFSPRLGPGVTQAIWWSMALLPIMGLSALRSAALRGLHHVVLAQVPESLVMPAVFVGLLSLGYALTTEFSAANAVMLRVVATGVALLTGAWFLLRRLPAQIRCSAPAYDRRTWARSALPLLTLGAMGLLQANITVLMLAALGGSEAAGVYHAASRGAQLVAYGLLIVGIAIQPALAHLYVTGELARLQRVVTASARVALALTAPVAIILIVYAGPILELVFGAEFQLGARALRILCVAQLFNAAMGSLVTILNMTGHEKEAAKGMAVAVVANVSLSAALIPTWGTDGAAVATAISIALWNIVLTVSVYRKLALWPAAIGALPKKTRLFGA